MVVVVVVVVVVVEVLVTVGVGDDIRYTNTNANTFFYAAVITGNCEMIELCAVVQSTDERTNAVVVVVAVTLQMSSCDCFLAEEPNSSLEFGSAPKKKN